ncbi:MAG: 2-oxo-4-hydroxy-4-carboxy-5-ureidoimidazoline decarboxylase [Rubrivivax sp.]|nr:2-oxo-4-hydroxy-4-carboxy-5-ureidoimidazoline decarboxylase [Rubrivivax sp.]
MSSFSLQELNQADLARFVALLDGTYEHSPWIAAQAWERRPAAGFATPAALKRALVEVVREAGREQQLALVRAHPELAGKAMVTRTLTAESSDEQGRAGLTDCTPQEFERIQQLNADYNARFGWPFILAVRGPRGRGLSRTQIIETFARRLQAPPETELAECLRQIHRIAEIRLNDKLGAEPLLGGRVWDDAETLAQHSDPGYAERGELTVTYLTAAHLKCQAQLQRWMDEAGFDETHVDAVGNVVGVYHGTDRSARRLLTGSHFDTVRNGGRYDGRLGVLVPIAVVRELHRQGRRLPFGLELVAFADEEGQRYKATFLGSAALTGDFDPAWLEQTDVEGVSLREAMRQAGLPATMAAIEGCRRDPARYLGFVELHIEQGPVLDALDLPLGVVTSINGSVRHHVEITGTAAHAGTTPMAQRRDAAVAAAELLLVVERRAAAAPETVGTVGMLQVPSGSINVIPGRVAFSLDLRATTNAARDALEADVLAELERICWRRGLSFKAERSSRVSAAPCHPAWQRRWEQAVATLGLPIHRMPSGAGHDAMKLHDILPQAMLFVRGANEGISHNPLESISDNDAELCVLAFQQLLDGLATDPI